VKLVALGIVRVAFQVPPVRRRRQLVLELRVAAEPHVAFLHALLAQALGQLVVVNRSDDEGILGKLLGVSLFLGAIHVGVPPRASLHVLSELRACEDGVLELVVHLVGDRDVVENCGSAVVVRPLGNRQPPSGDRFRVFRLVEVDLPELKIDLGSPWPLLREQ
jgi:hypothetical protein